MKKLNKKKIKELEKYKNDVPELTDALKKYLKDHDSLICDDAVESVLRITSGKCSIQIGSLKQWWT